MQQLEFMADRPLGGPVKASVWSRFTRSAARQWHKAQRRMLLRATARSLHGLSDRTLHDIGIDRSEIDTLVDTLAHGGRPERYDGSARRWLQ